MNVRALISDVLNQITKSTIANKSKMLVLYKKHARLYLVSYKGNTWLGGSVGTAGGIDWIFHNHVSIV